MKAIASLAGAALVRRALAGRPSRARKVLAVGKAAAAMAAGVDGCEGLIITKDAPAIAPDGFRVWLAGHPTPDSRSVEATARALAFVAAVSPPDELLVLLSGGTSALLGGPTAGISLDEMAQLT